MYPSYCLSCLWDAPVDALHFTSFCQIQSLVQVPKIRIALFHCSLFFSYCSIAFCFSRLAIFGTYTNVSAAVKKKRERNLRYNPECLKAQPVCGDDSQSFSILTGHSVNNASRSRTSFSDLGLVCSLNLLFTCYFASKRYSIHTRSLSPI